MDVVISKSDNKNKKYKAVIDGKKEIHFGAKGYDDFTTHKDKERKQIIEARNEGDSLAYSTEKQVEEHGDKLSDEDKDAIKSAISDMRLALDNENVGLDEINAKTLNF